MLSESASTLEVNIPIDPQGSQPANTFILQDIPPVTEVRYVSPSGARAISSTFTATVDLSGVVPGSGPVSVPVVVQSIDDRINVIDFTPDVVTVQLDELKTKRVPVVVDPGTIPDGLAIGTPTVSPTEVDVSGPASVVANVVAARAAPVIQTSGLNIDQSLPLDADRSARRRGQPGQRRAGQRAGEHPGLRGQALAVRRGQPGRHRHPGGRVRDRHHHGRSTVGDRARATPNAWLRSQTIDTEQVSVVGRLGDGRDDRRARPARSASPRSWPRPSTSPSRFRPITSTRNFEVGYRYVGADVDLRYSVPVDRVAIDVGGSKADLDRLEGSTLVADLDVSGLDPGTTDVAVTVDLPTGLTLVSANPATVPVTVTAPPSRRHHRRPRPWLALRVPGG